MYCFIFSFVMSDRSSVCLSVCLYQHGSHWTDFREIWYWGLLRKPAETLQISLQLDKNIGYFTWRPQDVYIVHSSTKLLYLDESVKRTLVELNAKLNTSIVDSYMQVNNSINVRYCWVSMATMVTRTRHNVTLHVHFRLFLWKQVNTQDLRFSWRYQGYAILQGNTEEFDEKSTLDDNYTSTTTRPKGLLWQCKPRLVLRRG